MYLSAFLLGLLFSSLQMWFKNNVVFDDILAFSYDEMVQANLAAILIQDLKSTISQRTQVFKTIVCVVGVLIAPGLAIVSRTF